MVDHDCPCEEELSKVQQIQCSICNIWWHVSCAGLTGLTNNAISKMNQWMCHTCFKLPEKLKEKTATTPLDGNIQEIQQQMEISLKRFISQTIAEELEKRLTEAIDITVKKALEKLMSTEAMEKQISEKVKKSQLANVTAEIEEKVNRRIQELPPSTVENEDTRKKVEKVIADQKKEKDRQDKLAEERLRAKKENNLMFFNLPEGDFEDTMDRMINDFQNIQKVYEGKQITMREQDLLQINRVGEKKANHVRPVVVTFASQEKRMQILTNNKDLKLVTEDNEIITIYVNTDKTPKQRTAEKELRKEKKRREDAGEENLVIRNGKIQTFRGTAQESWASKFRH